MLKLKRSGDVNLIKVKEAKGKIIKHDGSFVLARGEATGSIHLLKVKNPDKLIIRQDENGMYFELLEEGQMTHTADHEIVAVPKGIYKQVPEREQDHFADSITRKVVD